MAKPYKLLRSLMFERDISLERPERTRRAA